MAPKIVQMVIFGINLRQGEKSSGSRENLEYRCTTRNLPLYNDTIIVLEITPLNSVSVITNFVIRKNDKTKQKTSHFFVYS